MFQEMLAPDRIIRSEPLFLQSISGESLDEVMEALPSVSLGMEQEKLKQTESHLYSSGGMPPLIHITDERERQFWISDYNQTYLERDLADLASLNDLKPFRRFHQLAALRAGQLLSYSELARDAGIAVETARRYLEYLSISYQAFLLQPYYRNLTSTLVKTPKLYWFDNGLLRHLSGMGPVPDTGYLFENYLAAELMKYIRTMRIDLKLYFYRTRSGMEVDFLLESPAGVLGIEVKNRDDVVKSDFSRLKALRQALGEAWLGGLVVYRGNTLYQQEPGFWAVPSTRLLQ
jgi:predicted AAA+ superfamily ATPase